MTFMPVYTQHLPWWFAWRFPSQRGAGAESPNEAIRFIKALFASSLPCKSKNLISLIKAESTLKASVY